MLKVKGSSSQELVFIMSILCASFYDSYVKISLCKWQEILSRICLIKKKTLFFPCAMLTPMVEFGKHYETRFSEYKSVQVLDSGVW